MIIGADQRETFESWMTFSSYRGQLDLEFVVVDIVIICTKPGSLPSLRWWVNLSETGVNILTSYSEGYTKKT